VELVVALAGGAFVGLSLGLTGGGGSIFAVPLLMYAHALAPRAAVPVSLATVGLTALTGAAQRLRAGEVELRPGLVFAAAGAAGAPLGQWVGGRAPERVMLLGFAVLMIVVAARMWIAATRRPEDARAVRASRAPIAPHDVACRRDPVGKLRITSRCFTIMMVAGLTTGALSGAFGVGGGFLCVPALVFVTQMSIHHAVATSLLVITVVSAAGVAAHLVAGNAIDLAVGAPFAAGAVLGMLAGTLVAKRLSGPTLQKVFAGAIVLVGCFVVARTL
jgi:uncharacterized membrane protein YfcA